METAIHEHTPGSARVSRAGDGVSPSRTFRGGWNLPFAARREEKFVAVEHRDQHARRVRSPEFAATFNPQPIIAR
jgi:hypothetical protein